MLVPLAAPFFALLASAPAVVAQANAASSSLPATADVTLRVTTTLPVAPAQTGEVTNTTPTTDENSRIKFITELEYTSQQDLAMHKVISPNSTVYHVCSVANAIEFDYPIPSPPSDKNPKGTTLGFLVGTPSGNETILSGTLYDIDPGFAGKKIAAVNWTSSGRCVAGSNYYLTIVDKGCLENTTAFVQGCIWAVSDKFEMKPQNSQLSLPVPEAAKSAARALSVPAAATFGTLLAFFAIVL